MPAAPLPPGQQLVAAGKWPTVGERTARADDAPWSVTVAGEVARQCVFTLADLRAIAQVEQVVDIHCVTRWSKLAVRFGGVPLGQLIAAAMPTAAAQFVSLVARSARGHSTSLSLADAISLRALVALSVDGAPLDALHGGPVRVVVPGRYFFKSLKWLERVELLAEDRLGFWESTAGYHNTADPWQQQRYLASGISKADARAILEQRDIRHRDLRGIDAHGRTLVELQALGALLRDANFRDCSLERACFDGANLSNAHLQGANLRGASFRDADLEGADFAGADLRGACLLGASLFGASFVELAEKPGGAPRAARFDRHTQIEPRALDDLTPGQLEFVQGALEHVRSAGQ